mmetsp:Transcript_19684/g.36903  ORF Transcript_19684/g.36903 Transcript_19684/m.36903 type:complete len:200 (+) Transcript_19684:1933-2532(+)
MGNKAKSRQEYCAGHTRQFVEFGRHAGILAENVVFLSAGSNADWSAHSHTQGIIFRTMHILPTPTLTISHELQIGIDIDHHLRPRAGRSQNIDARREIPNRHSPSSHALRYRRYFQRRQYLVPRQEGTALRVDQIGVRLGDRRRRSSIAAFGTAVRIAVFVDVVAAPAPAGIAAIGTRAVLPSVPHPVLLAVAQSHRHQ